MRKSNRFVENATPRSSRGESPPGFERRRITRGRVALRFIALLYDALEVSTLARRAV
jgi:hypothetical protein